jgi:putative restriction endonuclease
MNIFAIAPTDLNWFYYLKDYAIVDDVNFWTPTPWNIRKLSTGNYLYFMLKKPIRKIGGYGIFSSYENKSIKEAWDAFGINNGVRSLQAFYNKIKKYKKQTQLETDYQIGCINLKNCTFFDEDKYITTEEIGINFQNQIVTIKYYNQKNILHQQHIPTPDFTMLYDTEPSYKELRQKERKGQQFFRALILRAYNNRCCITGEFCEDVLEASHIQQYISEASNAIQNGLCLRSDLHQLFDRGLITITPDHKIIVSNSINSQYYRSFHERSINTPTDNTQNPSREALQYHNKNIFRGTI